jgi:hypothetical protein
MEPRQATLRLRLSYPSSSLPYYDMTDLEISKDAEAEWKAYFEEYIASRPKGRLMPPPVVKCLVDHDDAGISGESIEAPIVGKLLAPWARRYPVVVKALELFLSDLFPERIRAFYTTSDLLQKAVDEIISGFTYDPHSGSHEIIVPIDRAITERSRIFLNNGVADRVYELFLGWGGKCEPSESEPIQSDANVLFCSVVPCVLFNLTSLSINNINSCYDGLRRMMEAPAGLESIFDLSRWDLREI